MHDRSPDCHPVYSQLKVASICKLHGSSMCLAYFLEMLSVDVYTTSHWQTSGRLMQELNVCTVGVVSALLKICV